MTGPAPTDPDHTPEVLARFAEARLWAAAQAPYLASALFALRPVVLEPYVDEETGEPVPDDDFRAFPADTRWNVHLDPGATLATAPPVVGWWLLHHIGHLVRHHATRSPVSANAPSTHATGEAGAPDSIARRWNQAADAEVNDDLEAAGLDSPAGIISPHALGLPEGRLAEEYLSLIEVLDTAHSKGGRRLAELIDCGSAADGIPHDYEDSASGDGLSETERDILELAVAREIETRSAARATIPGGWRRWASERLHPAVDWRAELGAMLRRGARQAAGRVDFSYSRPSRRPAVDSIVMPAMVAPAPEIALVIDTSGSITPAILTGFLAEVTAIIARASGPSRRLHVICCDLNAHPVQTIRRAEDIELLGGGGTDMREGISAALALRPRPDLILVLTDGQTPWPDHRPPVPVVVGLVEPGPGYHTETPPPGWAHVIALPATA
ncbi:DUF2201 family putative metallopeptidase [Cumulibacter soli]|uniref:vWA domain-containing protein n=1 Tax=Cumulibacter soli TaxID=2546344 RepID=UPI00106888AC|nr:VWA-like domain-containing protein [Cumulibacter soli]